MLLEIKQQKNGTIVLRAPDGEIYAFDLEDVDKDTANKLFAKLGKTVLQILSDPDQPEVKTEPSGHVHQGDGFDDEGAGGPANTEGALRGLLDSLVPGMQLSRGLDLLQNMSSDSEETGS
jgi:hypothetical protein